MRKKIYLYITGFIILYLILGGVAVFPLMEGIQKSSKEFYSQKKNLATFAAQSQGMAGFKKSYQKLEPDLKKANQLFIDSEAPIDFLDFLEKTASSSEVSFEVSSAKYNSPPQKRAFFRFRTAISGSFGKLLEFIEKLENSPYLIQVHHLGVDRVSPKEASSRLKAGDIQADFSIRVYAQKD